MVPKIDNFVEDVVPLYSLSEFRSHFRLSREQVEVCTGLVNIKFIELLQVLACCLDYLFFYLCRMSSLPLVLCIWIYNRPNCHSRTVFLPAFGHWWIRSHIVGWQIDLTCQNPLLPSISMSFVTILTHTWPTTYPGPEVKGWRCQS